MLCWTDLPIEDKPGHIAPFHVWQKAKSLFTDCQPLLCLTKMNRIVAKDQFKTGIYKNEQKVREKQM